MNQQITDYKQEAFARRKSQQSTVTAFETDDPVRRDELRIMVKNAKYKTRKPEPEAETKGNGNGDATITFGDLTTGDYTPRRIIIDPWTGAREYRKIELPDSRGRRKAIESLQSIEQTQDQNSVFTQALAQASTGMSFSQALQFVDETARKEPTLALFESITEKRLYEELALPVQSWSHSVELLKTKSWILIQTNDVTQFSPATRRSVSVVEPPISTEKERETAIKALLQTMKDEPNPKIDPTMIRLTTGLNLHDLESTLLDSIYRTNALDNAFITRTKIDIIRSHGFDLVYPSKTWDYLGGYRCIRDFYETNLIATLNDELAQTWKLEPTRGVIEFGVSGTGKSLRAEILATVLNVPFIRVNATNIFGGIVSESEYKVRRLIQMAEANAPCVLFMDELDQYFPRRGSVMATDSGVQMRVQNSLMDWLGDNKRKSIVIGATNLITRLDQAGIRAGRFDDILPVLYPDAQARKDIIHVHAQVWRKIPLNLTELDLERLVKQTALWSGAELESLVKKAARRARQESRVHVSLEDFNGAMQETHINIPQRKTDLLAFIQEAKNVQTINHRLLDEQTQTLLTELKDIQTAEGTYTRADALKDERE